MSDLLAFETFLEDNLEALRIKWCDTAIENARKVIEWDIKELEQILCEDENAR